MKYKTVLLLGGAGFIGSHLAVQLSKKMKVVVIDHFLHKEEDWFDIKSDNVKVYNTKITELNNLESIIICHEVDVIIDLVAMVKYNVNGNFNTIMESHSTRLQLLNLCNLHDVHYLYISSLDTITSRPQKHSDYVADKKNVENLILDLSERRYIKATVIRLGSVYGIPLFGNYTGVINKFIDAALKNLPLKIHEGHHYRNFLYIDDIYTVIFELLMMGRIGGVINLNGIWEIGIHDIANYIIEKTNSKSKCINISYDNTLCYCEEESNFDNHIEMYMNVDNMEGTYFYNNVDKIIQSFLD